MSAYLIFLKALLIKHNQILTQHVSVRLLLIHMLYFGRYSNSSSDISVRASTATVLIRSTHRTEF